MLGNPYQRLIIGTFCQIDARYDASEFHFIWITNSLAMDMLSAQRQKLGMSSESISRIGNKIVVPEHVYKVSLLLA